MNAGIENYPFNQYICLSVFKNLYGPWKKIRENGMILKPSENINYWTHKASNGVNTPAFLQHPDVGYFLYFNSEKSRIGLVIVWLGGADRLEHGGFGVISVFESTSTVLRQKRNLESLMLELDVKHLKEVSNEIKRKFSSTVVTTSRARELLSLRLSKNRFANLKILFIILIKLDYYI